MLTVSLHVPKDPPNNVPEPMLKAEGSKMHMILVRRGPETGLMVSAMEREAVWGHRVLCVGASGENEVSE